MYWFATEWEEDGIESSSYKTLGDHREEVAALLLGSDPQKLTTRWKSGGVERKVETKRLPGEQDDAFVERHFAAVLLAQQDHPPDAE